MQTKGRCSVKPVSTFLSQVSCQVLVPLIKIENREADNDLVSVHLEFVQIIFGDIYPGEYIWQAWAETTSNN